MFSPFCFGRQPETAEAEAEKLTECQERLSLFETRISSSLSMNITTNGGTDLVNNTRGFEKAWPMRTHYNGSKVTGLGQIVGWMRNLPLDLNSALLESKKS